jgi:hypothetical protein
MSTGCRQRLLNKARPGRAISVLDHDKLMSHPHFRTKLDALTSSALTAARVPVFLACLLVVGGVPALLAYRTAAGSARRARILALPQRGERAAHAPATAVADIMVLRAMGER